MKPTFLKYTKLVIVFFIVPLFYLCTKKVMKQKEETPTPVINPTPVNNACKIDAVVSYSKTVQSILSANCLPCHSSPSAFSFDSYGGSSAAASSGNLIGVITGDPSYTKMPPYNTMDSCDIKTIVNWVNQGYKNN